MGISVILVICLLGVFVLASQSNSMIKVLKNYKLVSKFKRKKLFRHYGATGMLLFFMNAILFFGTLLLLYGIQFLTIPFIHILVMVLAVGSSLFLWLLINLSWQGEARDRFKVGAIGSSFYFFLTGFFVYQYATIEPLFPGDDPFMRAIGFMFGIVVALVAFVTCFFLTGFARGRKRT